MSICSRHQVKEADCPLCEGEIADIPGFQDKLDEALASGIHTCTECEFEFYNMIDVCPKCGALKRPGSL